MKEIVKKIFGENGTLNKVTAIVNKSVTDKDARNDIVFAVYSIMMQSQVAKYVRALISIITLIGCMFFGDKLTIDAETQKYLLITIFGFYFADYVKSMFGKK